MNCCIENKISLNFRDKKFKKKWTDNKDGFWYERNFKTKLGKFTLYVDEDYKGREISITIGTIPESIKEDKLKNLDFWIEYLNGMI